MTSRLLAFIFVVASALTSPAWSEIVDATSTITRAVVYPQSARVTRTLKVDLKEGTQTVRLKGVLPNFDVNSLSVSGQGNASVKILGAGMKTVFIKDDADKRVRELESKIVAKSDEITVANNALAALEQKKAFLDSVRLFSAGQLPKDLVTKVPTSEELKATLAFLEEGARSYNDSRQEVSLKLRELNKELQVLQNELNQLRSGYNNSQQTLDVDLEVVKAGELTLEVAYTVPQVSWYPLYDARVEFEKGKAELSAFAVLRQTTGEDWSDVQLTLSTARPTLGGRMPELSSWYLRPYAPLPQSRNMFKTAMLAGAQEMDTYSANESVARFAEAPAARAKAEVAYAQADSAGVALVYKAAKPVTIKSDGSEVRVPLMSQTLDAAFEYAATPKLSPFAYLKSEVINAPENQLLAGRVNIFLDGTYVGNSDIATSIAAGEKFDLYLGVDEGVSLKRELIENKTDDTLIGGIPSPTRKISYVYKITVQNFKPRPVSVKLFDQVPVAQDDKIKVVKVIPSVKPDTDKYQDREGVYLWTLALAPREKKEITLSFVVEHPREMNIGGL